MRKLLVKILSVIVAITAMFGLISLPSTFVKAETEEPVVTFRVAKGASVKFSDKATEVGLRFTIEVNKEWYNGEEAGQLGGTATFGALVVPEWYAKENSVVKGDPMALDISYVNNAADFAKLQDEEEAKGLEDDGNYEYYATVTYNFVDKSYWTDENKAAALSMNLVCMPYYLNAEGEPVYGDLSDARCMKKVANGTFVGGELEGWAGKDDFIEKYLTSLNSVEEVDGLYVEADGTTTGFPTELEGVTSYTDHASAADITDFDLTDSASFVSLVSNKIPGENYTLSAFADGKIYHLNYRYVTKLISDVEDLNVFMESGDIDGYYLLTNNIDAGGFALNSRTAYDATNFLGTFDGNGNTIKGLTIPNWGMFGYIYGTVKNVAFVNPVLVRGANGGSDNRTILAHKIYTGANISDIYITYSLSARGHLGVLAYNTLETGAKITNVVIERSVNSYDTGMFSSNGRQYAILGPIVGDLDETVNYKYNSSFENTYIISTAPIYWAGADSTELVVAENQYDGTTLSGVHSDIITMAGTNNSNIYTVSGVKAYATYAEMASANNTLTSFNNDYWTTSAGYPVWNKAVNTSDVEVVVRDSEGEVVSDYSLIDNETEFTLSLENAVGALNNLKIIVPDGITLVSGTNNIKLTNMPTGEATYNVILTGNLNDGTFVYKTIGIKSSQIVNVNGVVNYSQVDKSFDFDAINGELGTNLSIENVESYCVGTSTEFTTGNEITLAVTVKDDKDGVESQVVKFKVGDLTYVLNNVMAYSKIIDEASDLNVFSADGTIDGYYILNNNIDDATFTLSAKSGSSTSVFTGVFDGQGYTISNIKVGAYGIFGVLDTGSVVKNVAFININLYQGNGNRTIFAYKINTEATISDVYIKQPNTSLNNYASTMFASNSIHVNATLSNIVYEHAITAQQKDSIIGSSRAFGLFGPFSNPTASGKVTNVYAISDAPLYYNGSSSLVVAENQLADGNIVNSGEGQAFEYLGSLAGTRTYAKGIKAYATYADMSAANNATTSFENNNWTIVNGVPYWKSLYSSFVNAYAKDSEGNDVDSLSDTTTELSLSLADPTTTLQNVEVALEEGATGAKIEDGKFSLTERPLDDKSYNITLSTTVNGIEINKTITIVAKGYRDSINLKVNGADSIDVTVANKGAEYDLTLESSLGAVDGSLVTDVTYGYNNEYISIVDNKLSVIKLTENGDSYEVSITANIGGQEFTDIVTVNVEGFANYISVTPSTATLTNAIDSIEVSVEGTNVSIENVVVNETNGLVITGNSIKLERLPLTETQYTVEVSATIEGVSIVKEITVIADPVIYNVENAIKFNAENKAFDFNAVCEETGSDLEFGDIVYYLVNNDGVEYTDAFDFAVEFENGEIISKDLTIVTNSAIYKLKVNAYTKFIDDAEDLNFFTTANMFDGYYLVVNNIDATGYALAGNKSAYNATTTGFSGVFDGNGYTISGIKAGSNGIFGRAYSTAVIKNVAFVNVTFTDSLIAARFDGTIDNAYVEPKEMPSGGAVIAHVNLETTARINNFVVKYNLNSTDLDRMNPSRFSNTKQFALLGTPQHLVPPTGNNSAVQFTNTYVISEGPIAYGPGTNYKRHMFVFAENQIVLGENNTATFASDWSESFLNTLATNAGYITEENPVMTIRSAKDSTGATQIEYFTGVKAYADAQAMVNANETLTGFNSYWTTTSGVPVWNNVVEESTAKVVVYRGEEVSDNLTLVDTNDSLTLSLTTAEGTPCANVKVTAISTNITIEGNVVKVNAIPVLDTNYQVALTTIIDGVGVTKVVSITARGYSNDINPVVKLAGEVVDTSAKLDISASDVLAISLANGETEYAITSITSNIDNFNIDGSNITLKEVPFNDTTYVLTIKATVDDVEIIKTVEITVDGYNDEIKLLANGEELTECTLTNTTDEVVLSLVGANGVIDGAEISVNGKLAVDGNVVKLSGLPLETTEYTATITATIEDEVISKSITITATGFGDSVVAKANGEVATSATVNAVGDEVALGLAYADVNATGVVVEIEENTKLQVTDNVVSVVALPLGDAEFTATITGTIYGETVTRTITITLNGFTAEDVELTVKGADDNEIADANNYVISEDNTSLKLALALNSVEAENVSVALNSNILTATNGVITINEFPAEDATVTATITATIYGETITKSITIKVTAPNLKQEVTIEDVIAYSAYDGYFDIDAVNKALDRSGENALKLADIMSYAVDEGEAQAFNGSNMALTVEIDNAGASRRVAKTYKVTLETETETIVLENVKAYNMFIDEASDFNVFAANDDSDTDWYVVVIKDIDATSTTLNNSNYGNAQFNGVLDGQGYTINGLTVGNYGIFGKVGDMLVKSIAFTNTKLAASNYSCLFAWTSNASVLEDVYLEIDTFGTRGAGFFGKSMTIGNRFTRVIVEYNVAQSTISTKLNSTNSNGNIGTFGSLTATYAVDNMFENSYSISNMPIAAYELNNTNVDVENKSLILASNQVSVDSTTGAITAEEGSWGETLLSKASALQKVKNNSEIYNNAATRGIDVVDGIEAYATYADVVGKDANANAFSGDYWVVSNGVPYWKSVYANYVNAVARDSEGEVVNDLTLTDTETALTLTLEDTKAISAQTSIEVEDGLTLDGNTVKLTAIPLNDTTYTATLTATVNGEVITRTIEITAKGYRDSINLKVNDADSIDVTVANKGAEYDLSLESSLGAVDGSLVTDVTYGYNNEYISIVDNKLSVIKLTENGDSYEVSITANIGGQEFTDTVTVNVEGIASYLAVETSGNELTNLDTQLTVSLKYNGEVVDGATVSASDANVSVDGNVVTMVSYPDVDTEYELTITATIEGVEITRTVVVVGKAKPAITVNTLVPYSVSEGYIDINAVNKALSRTGANALALSELEIEYPTMTVAESATGASFDSATAYTVEFETATEIITLTNVKAFTKFIDEASDLNMFTVTGNNYGYYAVVNNIDAEGFTLTGASSTGSAKFYGLFEGQGYTIANMTIPSFGIFGNIYGTVRNIAVINPTLIQGGAAASYKAMFAYAVYSGGVLSNIYTETESKATGHVGYLVHQEIKSGSTLSNIVMRHPTNSVDDSLATNSNRYGLLSSDVDLKGTLSDIYVISGAPLIKDNSKNVYVAANQYDNGSITGNSFLSDKSFTSINSIAGVKAYDDDDAMIEDNNTLTSFNSYWTTTSGVPVWNTANDFFTSSISGTELTDTTTELTITTDADDAVITASSSNVAINGNVITLNNVPVLDESYVVTVKAMVNGTVVIRQFTITASGYGDSIQPVVKDSEGGVVSEYVLNNPDEFFTITLNDDRATITSVTTSIDNLVWDSEAGTIKMTAYPAEDTQYEVTITATVEGEEITRVITVTGKAFPNIIIDNAVAYSAADKSIDIYSLNNALTANGLDTIESLEGINFTIDGTTTGTFATTDGVGNMELDATVSGSGLERDVPSYVVVLENATETITLNNVKAYTQTINEGADLKIFIGTTANGYYAVTTNIDAGGISLGNNGNYNSRGLSGVFDGQGYTISNFKTARRGIFGYVPATALIKDVAFVNVESTSDNPSLFGYRIIAGATLSNIYIENVTTTGYNNGYNFGIFSNYSIENGVVMSNVVIKQTAPESYNDKYYGLFGVMPASFTSASDCYVISGAPLYYDGTSSVWVASNQESVANITATTTNKVAGVKAYADYTAMAAATSNDYSTFNDCWDMTAGYPVWKTLPASN